MQSNVHHVTSNLIKNAGTGAGGQNTNVFGKLFELATDNRPRLLQRGFTAALPKKPWIRKIDSETETIFVSQSELKSYISMQYNIKLFRNPDEAYIIRRTGAATVVGILEKKEQHRDGSVETKLWAAPALKREYELALGNQFRVHYALCLNKYLKDKLQSSVPKYKILRQILEENDIHVMYGDDDDYFVQLDKWVEGLARP